MWSVLIVPPSSPHALVVLVHLVFLTISFFLSPPLRPITSHRPTHPHSVALPLAVAFVDAVSFPASPLHLYRLILRCSVIDNRLCSLDLGVLFSGFWSLQVIGCHAFHLISRPSLPRVSQIVAFIPMCFPSVLSRPSIFIRLSLLSMYSDGLST
jgi:hypothetical protein